MFSKEDSKKIRQDFWIFFGKRHPRKWLLYNTGIKNFVLKFSFDTKKAFVSIDVTSNDALLQGYYYEKLESLKKLMLEEISPELIFDSHYTLDSGKAISRVYLVKEGVSIHNKQTWPEVFEFFYNNMDKMEQFFKEYKDFITS